MQTTKQTKVNFLFIYLLIQLIFIFGFICLFFFVGNYNEIESKKNVCFGLTFILNFIFTGLFI